MSERAAEIHDSGKLSWSQNFACLLEPQPESHGAVQIAPFLADRLHLGWDEFNAVSVAGRDTVAIMDDNVIERERELVEEIRKELPAFVQACDSNVDFILMHQDAFGPKLRSDEIFLLGKAVKYAGLMGKEVRIIPSTLAPSSAPPPAEQR